MKYHVHYLILNMNSNTKKMIFILSTIITMNLIIIMKKQLKKYRKEIYIT